MPIIAMKYTILTWYQAASKNAASAIAPNDLNGRGRSVALVGIGAQRNRFQKQERRSDGHNEDRGDAATSRPGDRGRSEAGSPERRPAILTTDGDPVASRTTPLAGRRARPKPDFKFSAGSRTARR